MGGRVANPASQGAGSPTPNFTPAAQNGFAGRLLWSITSCYAGANHDLVVSIRGSVRREARPRRHGSPLGGRHGPDGHAVTVRWWRWKEVDTYPGDARPGQSIHLVLEATDA